MTKREKIFVACPACGYEQEDMGRHVECEDCGAGPMPTTGKVIDLMEALKASLVAKKKGPTP